MLLKDGTNIVSSIMSTTYLPSECKIAKHKPLFKRIWTESKNYRPIFLLLLISTIIEKVVYEKANVFLSENKESSEISIQQLVSFTIKR